MMLHLRLLLGSFALTAIACTGSTGTGSEGESGEGEGEGGANTSDIQALDDKTIDVPQIDDTANIALTVRADGSAALAWVNNRTDGKTVDCQVVFGGQQTTDAQDIVVADEQSDGSFRQRIVDTVPQTHGDAMALAVDPTSNSLVISYTGGAVAQGACNASDLMLALESGDSFSTPSTIIGGSDTGSLCRTPQNICAQGDVVGIFPSLAHSADGSKWALSYLDTHFGFADKDIHGSDQEIALSGAPSGFAGGLQTVDSEAGAGWFSNVALTPDGLPFIVQNIIASDNLFKTPGDPNSGTFTLHEGVYVTSQQSDGTWVDVNVFPSGSLDNRGSVAASSDGLFALYREQGTGQLILEHSVDNGKTFKEDFIERTGTTGKNPSVGFLSDGSLITAYGHCNNIDAGNGACDVKVDGVRFAWKDHVSDTKFNKKTFAGSNQDQDAILTRMVIAPDDTIIVASFSTNTASNARTIHVQRFKKVP